MYHDGNLNDTKAKNSVLGFLKCRRSPIAHYSAENDELARLSALRSPRGSDTSMYWDTPIKIRSHYLSESTVKLLPPPMPLRNMGRKQVHHPGLSVDTEAANRSQIPNMGDTDDVFSTINNSNPASYGDQKPGPLRHTVSLHKSRSTGAMCERTRPFITSPTRDGDLKLQYSFKEAKPSPQFSAELLSGARSDGEEIVQAKYVKLCEIGRRKGYEDEEIRQWFDWMLQHSPSEMKAEKEVECETEGAEVKYNESKVPGFTQSHPRVKEIEHSHLQSIFGREMSTTRQLLAAKDNSHTSNIIRDFSLKDSMYLYTNPDIASHTTLRASGLDFMSPLSNSTEEKTFHSAGSCMAHDGTMNTRQSDDESASSETSHLFLATAIDSHVTHELRESCGDVFTAKHMVAQQKDHTMLSTSDIQPNPYHEAFLSPTIPCTGLYPSTHTYPSTSILDSSGIMPLLLPLRYKKALSTSHKMTRKYSAAAEEAASTKRREISQPSSVNSSSEKATLLTAGDGEDEDLTTAMRKPARFERERKEQLTKATATLASIAEHRASLDGYDSGDYGSLIEYFEDEHSESADRLEDPLKTSIPFPDDPTLGYARFSTQSTTLQGVCTPTSSQFNPQSLPSYSPLAEEKMRLPRKSADSGLYKASSREFSVSSPSDTFSSSSSFNFHPQDSIPSPRWGEDLPYAAQKVIPRP